MSEHVPLPRKQAEELARIAECDRPTSSPTLLAVPMSYHGLLLNVKRSGFPEWVITERGQRWLAVEAERKSKRRPRRTTTKREES